LSYAVLQSGSGDTILVDAGTYNGNAIVNKSLTILGAGKDVTILDGTSGIGALATILLSSGSSDIQIGAIGQGLHIKGIDNGAPGIENAAVYLQGVQTNITLEGNNIEARGDAGLLGEYNAANDGIVINANMFTGQTFIGSAPAGDGFSGLFNLPNVPRQAVTFGGGTGTSNTMNFTFTNNDITAICGGISTTDNSGNPAAPHEQGNTLVTLDVIGTNTISNNNFNGFTNRYATALRVRGTGYTIEENRFTGGYALALATGSNPITATKNYWNASTGPYNPLNNPCATGKYVPDNVTFAPFYMDSALTTQSLVQPGPVENVSQSTFHCNIQSAIDAATNGDSIYASAGTYNEDVLINKVLIVAGAGAGQSTIVGQKGGNSATVRVSALGVVVDGFTITREGNTVADWNDASLNSAGVAIQGQTVSGEIRNCELVGNRSAIDVNNSNGNNIHNNVITNNHTGMIFRNQTDNTILTENQITANRTVGVLFLDASGGTNSPIQQALNSSFNNNNISGNWYGQIVDRQAGGSLPAPGTTNAKNFECNWYGNTDPVVSSSNSAEPGYGSLIPVVYGGTATAPVGQPDILGPGVENFDYVFFLTNGTDNAGAPGFQPVPNSCNGCPGGLSVFNTNTGLFYCSIQQAIDDPLTLAGHTISVGTGTYMEDLLVNKADLTLIGAGIDQSIIDHSGQPGEGNAGVYITANGVTMKGFTVIDNDGGSVPRYGLKVGTSSVTTDDVTLDSVKVTQSFRTGFDLARPKNIILKNIYAINNGGAGVFMTNTEGAIIQDATTSGNPWTGVSISTRSDWAGDASGIFFIGNNSFAEDGSDNGGIQLEMVPGKTISWSTDSSDAKDVTLQLADASYVLSGPTVNAPYDPYFRFFTSLTNGQNAAGGGPDHVEQPRYLRDADNSDLLSGTQFYVYDFADTAMTIQAAIDAAIDGNTINVFGGEFIEQVEISKDLTLTGQGKGVTTIKGYPNMPLSFTTSGPNKPVVYVHDANLVAIQNLTVDGDGQGNTNNRYQGVAYSNAGGSVTDVEVKAMRHSPLNGVQGGIGIFIDASDGTPRNVLVRNCMVYDFQKTGMSFSGADLLATADSNMITGSGSLGLGLPAQNGIQFFGTNGGTIAYNQIGAINYTPNSYVATGILTYFGSDTIKVVGNVLDSVEVGVFGYDNSLQVQNNTMTGGDYGLYGYSDATGYFAAQGNFISNFDFGALMYATGGTLSSVIQQNSITAFDTSAIVALGAADSVEAQCNWYGLVDPIAIAAANNGQVKFEPYLTSGVDDTPMIGFQPEAGVCNGFICPDTLFVNDGASTGDVYTTALGNDLNPGTATAPFATIQAAVNRACAGSVIMVDAGTYTENVSVNKVLSVIGVDTNSTIIQGAGGNVVTLTAGTSGTNRTMLAQVKVTGGASGIVAASHTSLINVLSTNNSSYGVNMGSVNDLIISNSCFTHNNVGLKIPSTASVTNLFIDGSEFSYNTQHGWYSDANSGVEPDLDIVNILNTAFNFNGIKGIYTERLSNALFKNVTVQSSGIASNTYASGIDINLKWKDYENIEFNMVTVSGSGIGGAQGTGVTIKGRNDGGTYGGNPASLNNLVFVDNNFASPGVISGDTLTGVALGNAITNISFVGTNSFTGTGNGFTSYIDGGAMAPFSLGTSDFDGSLAHYIKNLSVVDVEALATLFNGKIGNDMNAAELISTEDRILHKPDTSILGLVYYFDNCADGSCDGCYTANGFNEPVLTGASQVAGVWYTDRYAPDSFYVDATDSSLVHLIDATDGSSNRPASFSSAFYNTQGRKYDLDSNITMISIDLYVPASWATTGRRMAGLWGTVYNSSASISGYPIIEFVSDNADPRFRLYDNGSWKDMGLPCDFQYDEWYALRMEILPAGEFRFSVNDLRMVSENFGMGHAYFGNAILQGHNDAAGVTYQINWDNFVFGRGPEINYNTTGPDAIAIGSGLSNQNMAVGEFCGLSASIKAHKRFLGDVVPDTGNVAGDTYQFGTGVSPTSAANTTPDPGTARWNYLVSVNLGTFTFNDLNVYLDIDFDNSDSACQVGPYVADLSAFMISNGLGGNSVFQGSENLGFAFWQGIGDPSILPFDPYAEGVYDLAVRIENKEGIELIHVPIRVEVGCEFVDPAEDLEPPVLICPADVTVQAAESTNPDNTGMASVTGSCPQNLTYGDDISGLVGCNGTGTLVRTWYNQDSTQSCNQNIIIVDTVAPVLSACPADTVLFATSPAGASLLFEGPIAYEGFFEGFEDAIAPANAWNPYNNNVVRVATGTDGIISKTGGYHATIDPTDATQTGAFTRLGGYSSDFGNGFTASQDIYIDLTDTTVANNTYGWDLSTAVNNQSNAHRRDFIFHAASNASGNVLIAGSNNSNFTRRNDLASLNNYEITSSGWYTFEWVFRDSAGSLAVDLNLLDASGTHLFTETRFNVSDSIATAVGGNRYMWFTFFETSKISIDNTTLNKEVSVSCSASSGDTFPLGVTTVTCVTTDNCGNADSCSFDVTVIDTAGALNFDGLNDVVSVPHDASLSGFGNTVTVEAWIRPEKVTGRQGIVGKWNDLGSNNRRSVLLWASNDDVQFYVSGNGSNFPSALATNALTVGEWTHVAGTFDGNIIKVYINGVLSASTGFNGTLYNNSTDPLLIGAVDGGGSSRQHFDGDIDEVRLYNRVLCADEIMAHKNCELTGSEAGLAASYSFNQGFAYGNNSGLDSAVDRSANGNTGLLQNFALNGATSNWTLSTDSLSGGCSSYAAPLLTVYGNNQSINAGDVTPDVADSTDFGTVNVGESNENCFYLVNTGTDVLNVSSISVSGGDATEFSVGSYGSGAINPGDSAQVCITYSPSSGVAHFTTVEVVSDDCLASTFAFAIQGEGYEQTCDTVRLVSNTDWMMSSVITSSNLSGGWNGVMGNLPANSTYTVAVDTGQPFSFPTIFAVDSSTVIKSGNNIRYYKKSIVLDTLVDISAQIRSSFAAQSEVYVNGKLLAGHYQFSNNNDNAPGFAARFESSGNAVNGYSGGKAYSFLGTDTMDNVFVPGQNDIVVVVRNLNKSNAFGGFSFSMQVDGCQGEITPPTPTPVDTLCDTTAIVANAKWKMSTTVTPSTYSGIWSGVNGNLPDTSTFTQSVSLGQPFSYQTIFPVDSSSVIKVSNNIRYFHRRMVLDSIVDIGARLRSTFDDQVEIYINGNLFAAHYGFSNQNSKLPPFDASFIPGGGVVNGFSGNKPFEYVTVDTLDNLFKPGVNDVIVVLRNLANSGDVGGFSINLLVNGCNGEVEVDTSTPPPADTLGTSVVSDNGWSKSTEVEGSNFSGNWSGAATLPPTATYTLPAVEGQPYSYPTIDPIDSAKVIKTGSNITFFRKEFELIDNIGLNARFRMNVDDAMEIYINGKLVARENNSGAVNFKNPNHDLKFTNGSIIDNGHNGGDLFDWVTSGSLDTFFVTGSNEIVLAVRNKARSGDAGGFTFRLDIDKAGSKVIVKDADASSAKPVVQSTLDFDIYPNPTGGLIYVDITGKLSSGNNEIIVQDVSGRVIRRGSFEAFSGDGNIQIDMSDCASGVYLVKVISGDAQRTKRIMKN
jgi:hypothetical protein